MEAPERNEKAVTPALRKHVEERIIPQNAAFDAAHREDHARQVIEESLALAACRTGVDPDMAYAVAAYHDVGLAEGREHHHEASARRLLADRELRRWFSEAQLRLMAEAVEDHRASSGHAPRSIYGCIVAEADRRLDATLVVRRTVQYGLAHYPQLDAEGHYRRMKEHLLRKYGPDGYLRLWMPDSPNAARLARLRKLMADEELLHRFFGRIYRQEGGK